MLTGKCLCRAVTWQAKGPVFWAGTCHCESCRRANSAPMVPFFGVPRDGLEILGEVSVFRSSKTVERGFCKTCGTPVFYRNDIWPEECHLMAVTLDNPDQFQPQAHYHWAERVAWVTVQDDLPKYPGSADSTDPI